MICENCLHYNACKSANKLNYGCNCASYVDLADLADLAEIQKQLWISKYGRWR